MANKLLLYTAVLGLVFFQTIVMSADDSSQARSGAVNLQAEGQSTRGKMATAQMAEGRSTLQPRTDTPINVEVLSFTRLDPLPEYMHACEGCTAITIVFSVTCIRPDGCENLSVMDFYVTYESNYPMLFYGDESPNPALQGENHAGIIYGAQKEFSETSLEVGRKTIGELSFTVKPDASNFRFHHHRYGHDHEDVVLELVEDMK